MRDFVYFPGNSESCGPVLNRNKQSQWTCANGLTRTMKIDNLDVSMILYFVYNVHILYRKVTPV